MRRKLLLFAFLLTTAFGFAQQQSSVIGTWKLLSGKMLQGDSTLSYGEASLNAIKIVTPTHFAVLGQNPDGSFSHASAGRVTITPTTYTESLTHGTLPSLLGKDVTFTYEVKGDTWHVKGASGNISFEETWARVK